MKATREGEDTSKMFMSTFNGEYDYFDKFINPNEKPLRLKPGREPRAVGFVIIYF